VRLIACETVSIMKLLTNVCTKYILGGVCVCVV